MKRIAAIFAVVLFLTFTTASQKAQAPKLAATAHAATLTWTQGTVPAGSTCPSGTGSTAITGNTVFRGTTSGAETSLFVSPTPITTYTDSAVTAGTTYFYTVSASNCNGNSNQSAEVSGTIPNPVAPGAPTGVTVTAQ